MIQEQVVPALIAALVDEGVDPQAIERAVARVRDMPPGRSISGGNPLVRAFAFEQARLVEVDGPWSVPKVGWNEPYPEAQG